jgi:diguanylate cyclase (GGDEF)-like protein
MQIDVKENSPVQAPAPSPCQQDLQTPPESPAEALAIMDGRGSIRFLTAAAERLFRAINAELLDEEFTLPLGCGGKHKAHSERTRHSPAQIELRFSRARWKGETVCLISLADSRSRKSHLQRLQEANARLEVLARMDELTGLHNYRSLKEQISKELPRTGHRKSPLSIAMMDVDEFKDYNDAFGHPAGDEVLRAVGSLLKANVRPIDFVARYGGEEFVILMPGSDRREAFAVAERLRCAIESAPWPTRRITVSLGIATVDGRLNTFTALVAAADYALYHSKRGGRNRVTHFLDCGRGPAFSSFSQILHRQLSVLANAR